MEPENVIKEFMDIYIAFNSIRTSFDAFCRKKDKAFVLKYLTNIDALERHSALYLKNAAKFMEATPFIIGEKTNKERLRDDTIYYRFSIPGGTANGLINFYYGVIKKEKRVKNVVNIDAKKMKELREKKNISLARLSKETGISIHTLHKYEMGLVKPEEKNARKISEILGDITKPVAPKRFEMITRVKLFIPSKEGINLPVAKVFLDYNVDIKTATKRSKVINKFIEYGLVYVKLGKKKSSNIPVVEETVADNVKLLNEKIKQILNNYIF